MRDGGRRRATHGEGRPRPRAHRRVHRPRRLPGARRPTARPLARPEGRRAAVLHRPRGGRWAHRRRRGHLLRPGCVGGEHRPVRARPVRRRPRRPDRRLAARPGPARHDVGDARRPHDDQRPHDLPAARLRRDPGAPRARAADPGWPLPRRRGAGLRDVVRRHRRRRALPAGPRLRRDPRPAGGARRLRPGRRARRRRPDRTRRGLARGGPLPRLRLRTRRHVRVADQRERLLHVRGREQLRAARADLRQPPVARRARAGGAGLASTGPRGGRRRRRAGAAAPGLPLRAERCRPAGGRPDAAAAPGPPRPAARPRRQAGPGGLQQAGPRPTRERRRGAADGTGGPGRHAADLRPGRRGATRQPRRLSQPLQVVPGRTDQPDRARDPQRRHRRRSSAPGCSASASRSPPSRATSARTPSSTRATSA